MTIFSEDSVRRIRSTLVNARSEVEMAIPINDDYTIHITSERGTPANRAWQIHVKITTTLTPDDDEESPHVYLHEVNEEGQNFVDEWEELIEGIPYLTDHSWDFMVSSVFDCGDGVEMATYSERVRVNAEDLLESTVTDERLVRVSYTVPREMFVVVDADVDLDETQEVLQNVQNMGFRSVPLVELEPEMVRPAMSPYDSPSIPTVDVENVDDLSIDVVESDHQMGPPDEEPEGEC